LRNNSGLSPTGPVDVSRETSTSLGPQDEERVAYLGVGHHGQLLSSG